MLRATEDEIGAYFASLGKAVSQAWTAAGRRVDRLPDVAGRTLAAIEVPGRLSNERLLAWAASTASLPVQSATSDEFGQPPLNVYRETDFFVQALTWMDGTTAIHQHGFAGAFMLLQGASLHIQYDFSDAVALHDDRLVVGDLTARSPEVLRTHDIRHIDPGKQFIHALFHLERPTLTVVVRNDSCRLPEPQYSYRSPGLGWDGLWRDRSWSRRIQCVDTLTRLDSDAGRRLAQGMVADEPLWQAFCLADHWCARYGWNEVSAGLVDIVAGRAAPLAGVLGPAFAQEAYVRRILARRGMLHILHQRVLLALMANLSDAAAVTNVLESLFPGQPPLHLLLDWIDELAAPALRGVSGVSLSAQRLAELRSGAVAGREEDILGALREVWEEPTTFATLMS